MLNTWISGSSRWKVTAINDQRPNLTGRGFLVWFRKQFNAGDAVKVTWRNAKGESESATYTLSREDH